MPPRRPGLIMRTPDEISGIDEWRVRKNFDALADIINSLYTQGFLWRNEFGVWSLNASGIIPGPPNPFPGATTPGNNGGSASGPPIPGPRGSVWYTGAGPPGTELGDPNDFYFEANGQVWTKESQPFGVPPRWLLIVNVMEGLQGPSGKDGRDGAPGTPGGVGPPGQNGSSPTFGPAANFTSTDTVSNSTTWAMNWTAVSDPSGYLSGGTKLVAPATGYYLVSSYLHWSSNATGFRIGEWRINGTTFVNGESLGASTNVDDTRLNIQAVLQLNNGDYVEMAVFQNSGGNLGFILATAAIFQLKTGL